MGDPVFGVVIRQVDEESRPIIGADLSTIGIIGPAPDADADLYPLNTPVLIYSNETAKTSKLGASGYLADAVRAVNDQLGEMQFAARIVVVRTALGTDSDSAIKLQQTISNIVGSSTSGTGIYTFLKAVGKVAVTPRLIAAPGYTGLMANSIDVTTLDHVGTGYVEGQVYNVTFSGGGDNAVQAYGTAIGQSDGSLGELTLLSPGAWYDEDADDVIGVADLAGLYGDVALVTPGTGYAVNDTITLQHGVVVRVDGVSDSPAGAITAISIINVGLNTEEVQNNPEDGVIVETSGSGDGAGFTINWSSYITQQWSATVAIGGNPICVALTSVLNQLLAHAVVESSGTSQENDEDWRETMSSKRLIPVSGGCKILDPDTAQIVYRPIAPRILGVAVRRDQEKGAPFHSWANQAIQGIVGPYRDIGYSLTDDANEAQQLLKNNIGVVVRGELGNEFAIASGGFIFIGTDNAGEDELWRFYNMTRGRDFIHLSLLRSMRYYLGRYNITIQTVQAVMNGMKALLRDLSADGHILGYKINFNPASNSADQIRSGHLTVGFKAEEAAPLRKLTIESARYREAVDAMISELAAQLNLAA